MKENPPDVPQIDQVVILHLESSLNAVLVETIGVSKPARDTNGDQLGRKR